MKDEERIAVLKMVAAGKVTPEEAEQLFGALEGPAAARSSGLGQDDDFFQEGTFDFEASPITLDVPDDARLTVRGSFGPVSVVGTDEPELTVSGHPSHYKVDREQGALRISARRFDVPVTVHAPRTIAALQASSDTARVTVEDLKADVHAKTEAGDILVQRVEGAVQASTEAGAITLSDIVSSDVQARLTVGDVSVDLTSLTEGTVELQVQEAGGVELRVPPDAAFEVSAVVSEMGEVHTDLPLVISRQGPGYLQGTLNGGGAAVRIAVNMGEIHIRSRRAASEE